MSTELFILVTVEHPSWGAYSW